jgi:hypothetical protein
MSAKQEQTIGFTCRHSDVESLLFNWLKNVAATDEDRRKIDITRTRFMRLPFVQVSANYEIEWSAQTGQVDQERFAADKSRYLKTKAQYERLSQKDKESKPGPREPREIDYLLFETRSETHAGQHKTELLPAFNADSHRLGEYHFDDVKQLVKTMPPVAASGPREHDAFTTDEPVVAVTRPSLETIFNGLVRPISEMIGREIQKTHLGGTRYWKELQMQKLDDANCRFNIEKDLSLPFVLVDFTRSGIEYSCVFDGANPQRVVGLKPQRTAAEMYASFKNKFLRVSTPKIVPAELSALVQTGGAAVERVGIWRSLLRRL